MQLVVPHINSDDVVGTAFQKHLCKAASRCADIQCSPALHIKIEVIERCYEL
ncbi:hypothetical protein D9M69_697400 [compost metagenome]